MTEPGYPVATQEVATAQPLALTPEEQATVDQLYDELKPMATASARDYVLARTPALYQEAMVAKIDADWPVPPAEDPAALESRRLDGLAYLRRADASPDAPGPVAGPR
jgi:hypothetical protein